MIRNVRIAAGLMVVGLVMGACSKKQPPVQPPPQTQTPTQTQTQTTSTPVRDNNAEREAEMRRAAMSVLEQLVYFDYDDYTIRADAKLALAAKAQLLREHAGIRMRIEGHADDRGSVEYNLALGMRRANAVKEYLTDFGLDASRFDTQSFGEDSPLVQGSTEAAWSQNRRAEFRVSGMTR
jgi:peptidoglycan-associated lipoprotein